MERFVNLINVNCVVFWQMRWLPINHKLKKGTIYDKRKPILTAHLGTNGILLWDFYGSYQWQPLLSNL